MSILDDPKLAAMFGLPPSPSPVRPDATSVAYPSLALKARAAEMKARQAQQTFSADSSNTVGGGEVSNLFGPTTLSQSDRQQIASIPKHAKSGRALALQSLDDLDTAEDERDAASKSAKNATPPSLRK